eukprot:TRINITY_DN56581_c0_g1_i1.p1 TRINITY_DN56581_c0_g1~~TRINITY_DN56581_c0_g1_i1.p1  ORF type:complete len:1453 (+),score=299.87 TRINITY_DN56581_c0_g1_i1:80-4360(+)
MGRPVLAKLCAAVEGTSLASLWIPPSIEAALRLDSARYAPRWPDASWSPSGRLSPKCSPKQSPPSGAATARPAAECPGADADGVLALADRPATASQLPVPPRAPYSPRNPNKHNYRNFSTIPSEALHLSCTKRRRALTARRPRASPAVLLPRPRPRRRVSVSPPPRRGWRFDRLPPPVEPPAPAAIGSSECAPPRASSECTGETSDEDTVSWEHLLAPRPLSPAMPPSELLQGRQQAVPSSGAVSRLSVHRMQPQPRSPSHWATEGPQNWCPSPRSARSRSPPRSVRRSPRSPSPPPPLPSASMHLDVVRRRDRGLGPRQCSSASSKQAFSPAPPQYSATPGTAPSPCRAPLLSTSFPSRPAGVSSAGHYSIGSAAPDPGVEMAQLASLRRQFSEVANAVPAPDTPDAWEGSVAEAAPAPGEAQQAPPPPPPPPPREPIAPRPERLRRKLDQLDAALGWPVPPHHAPTDALLDQRGTQRSHHAVVIGCCNYADPGVPPCPMADALAEETAALLRRRGYSVDELRMSSPSPLLRPTRTNVIRVLRHARCGYPEVVVAKPKNALDDAAVPPRPPPVVVVFAGRAAFGGGGGSPLPIDGSFRLLASAAPRDSVTAHDTPRLFARQSTTGSCADEAPAAEPDRFSSVALLLPDTKLRAAYSRTEHGGLPLGLLNQLTDAEGRPVCVFADMWPVAAVGAAEHTDGEADGLQSRGLCLASCSPQSLVGRHPRPRCAGALLMLFNDCFTGELLRGRVVPDMKRYVLRFGTVAAFLAAGLEELGIKVHSSRLGRDAPLESAVLLGGDRVPLPAEADAARDAMTKARGRVKLIGWVNIKPHTDLGDWGLLREMLHRMDTADRAQVQATQQAAQRSRTRLSGAGDAGRRRSTAVGRSSPRPSVAAPGVSPPPESGTATAEVSPWDAPAPDRRPSAAGGAADPLLPGKQEASQGLLGGDADAPPRIRASSRSNLTRVSFRSPKTSRVEGGEAAAKPPQRRPSRRVSSVALTAGASVAMRRASSASRRPSRALVRSSSRDVPRGSMASLSARRPSLASRGGSHRKLPLHHCGFSQTGHLLIQLAGNSPGLSHDLVGRSSAWVPAVQAFLGTEKAQARMVQGAAACIAVVPKEDRHKVEAALARWRASAERDPFAPHWETGSFYDDTETHISEVHASGDAEAGMLNGHLVHSVRRRCEVVWHGKELQCKRLERHAILGSYADLFEVVAVEWNYAPQQRHAHATTVQRMWRGHWVRLCLRRLQLLEDEELRARGAVEAAFSGALPGARARLFGGMIPIIVGFEKVDRKEMGQWEAEERFACMLKYVQASDKASGPGARQTITDEEELGRLQLRCTKKELRIRRAWERIGGMAWSTLAGFERTDRESLTVKRGMCDKEYLSRMRIHNQAMMTIVLSPHATPVKINLFAPRSLPTPESLVED